jgi:DNA-binding response OmpR family regulator
MIFRKRYKVLIVDDDEDMLLLYDRILRDAKYKVFKARNGKECIEQVSEVAPDVIIMDIMMPEMDGIATVLKLRSKEKTRSIPIVMCTAVKEEEDEIIARNLGVADYCRKTPQMEDLLIKIKRILKK